MSNFTRKMRARRDQATFERALRNAGPSMRQELSAAAARSQLRVGTRRTGI